ncbi:MAG TPA: hypothetical protein VFH73_03845 [Polyangia bacterium]|jgi:hypothetical protein|nr:hypothetical protein [Polyangia bacterium]
MIYEAESKSTGGAVALELIPGAGSIYAGDTRGAFLTWGLCVGGISAMVLGVSQLPPDDSVTTANRNRQPSPLAVPLFLGGLAMAAGGRIWGFVNAYRAAERYNAGLAARLGLGSMTSLSVAPFISARADAGLALGGHF